MLFVVFRVLCVVCVVVSGGFTCNVGVICSYLLLFLFSRLLSFVVRCWCVLSFMCALVVCCMLLFVRCLVLSRAWVGVVVCCCCML